MGLGKRPPLVISGKGAPGVPTPPDVKKGKLHPGPAPKDIVPNHSLEILVHFSNNEVLRLSKNWTATPAHTDQ